MVTQESCQLSCEDYLTEHGDDNGGAVAIGDGVDHNGNTDNAEDCETIILNRMYMVYDEDEDDDIALHLLKISQQSEQQVQQQIVTTQNCLHTTTTTTATPTTRLIPVETIDATLPADAVNNSELVQQTTPNQNDGETSISEIERQRMALQVQSTEIERLISGRRRKSSTYSSSISTCSTQSNTLESECDQLIHMYGSQSVHRHHPHLHHHSHAHDFGTENGDQEALLTEIEDSIRDMDMTEYDTDSLSSITTDSDLHDIATIEVETDDMWSESESFDGDDNDDLRSVRRSTSTGSRPDTRLTISISSAPRIDSSSASENSVGVSSVMDHSHQPNLHATTTSSTTTTTTATTPTTPRKKQKKRSWSIIKQHVLRNRSLDLPHSTLSPQSPVQMGHSLVRRFSHGLIKRDSPDTRRTNTPLQTRPIRIESMSNVPDDIREWHRTHHSSVSTTKREDRLRKIFGETPPDDTGKHLPRDDGSSTSSGSSGNNGGNSSNSGCNYICGGGGSSSSSSSSDGGSVQHGNGSGSASKLQKFFGADVPQLGISTQQSTVRNLPHSYYIDTIDMDTMHPLFSVQNLGKYAGFREAFSSNNIQFETNDTSSNVSAAESSSSSSSTVHARNGNGTSNSSTTRLHKFTRRIICAGTLDKLIEWLTSHENSDTEFMNVFLLMYKSFTTPDVLFDKLMLRYNTPPPLNPLLLQPWDTLSKKQRQLVHDEFQQFLSSFLIPVRIRVVNVISTWVDRFYYDFRDDVHLRRRLMAFIDTLIHTHMEKPAAKISAIMLRRSKRRDTFTQQQIQELLNYSALNKITSKSSSRLANKFGSSTLGIRSRDIANQLTIICQGMFEKIQPKEFFGQGWTKKNRHRCSPNVVSMIRRSNAVGCWVAHEILTQHDIRDRVAMVKKMVKTAEKLRQLRNYNTLVEILSGLNSNPIHRLKLTWAAFERLQPDLMATFRELTALVSSKRNFAAMRSALKSEPPPAIPYIGMYLTDITFIEDGNRDLTSAGLINWTKRRWLAAIIGEVQIFQRSRYTKIADFPVLRAKLMNVNSPGLDALYDLSLAVEPRKQQVHL